MALSVAEFFASADDLPLAEFSSIVGHGGLLVVAPHPDDESLGCGGLLATAVRAGSAAHVVVVSDGTGSHPNSTHYPRDRLRLLRESETRTACRELGLSTDNLSFLRLTDTKVPSSGADAAAAVAAMVRQAQAIDAGTILVTWRHDPHCDHEACYALASAAARQLDAKLLQYPVWGHTGTDALAGPPRGVRLDIAHVLDRKKAAVSAHQSQTTTMIDDDPDGFILSPGMIARFTRPFEIYLED